MTVAIVNPAKVRAEPKVRTMHRAQNRDNACIAFVDREMLATPTKRERPVVALRDDQDFRTRLDRDTTDCAFHCGTLS